MNKKYFILTIPKIYQKEPQSGNKLAHIVFVIELILQVIIYKAKYKIVDVISKLYLDFRAVKYNQVYSAW